MNQLKELYTELHNKGVVSNKKEFAEWLGVKPGNLHLYLNDEIQLSINSRNFKKIINSGISINWLLTGEGEMFMSKNENLPAGKTKSIPLLRQTVSCGPGQDWQDADNIESYIEPLSLAAHGKELYAFRSRGISMVGTGIQDGDILIFDGARDQQLQDDIYVFGYNGEAFCKFLRFDPFSGKTYIYSVQNKDLDKAELMRTLDSAAEGFQIFGRVLCWIHENRLMWR